MSRLIVVSNRVPPPKGRQAAAGGLAVGVLAALRETGGIWFGWSGNLVADAVERRLELVERGKITYALLDLTVAEHAGHYGGMANRTLWPLFHYRIDLASFNHEWYGVYRDVVRLFAEQLMPLLQSDDRVWVHDFHLIPLGTELRRLGWQGRLGFFLHIPFPPTQLYVTMPWHRALAEDLCAYDAIGFQTPSDREHFADYAMRELGAQQMDGDWLHVIGRTIEVQAAPIGIDVKEVERLAASVEGRRQYETIRNHLGDRALIVGVDRLDYSKGIPERLRGFQALLERYPSHRRKTVLLQISAPSREDLPEYRDLRRTTERLTGHIIGRYGEADWMPLRYINRTQSRRTLAGYYRAARAGLVTPLRDGLNLVAEEFVAAQDAEDPGILVLSRFAGAAFLLDGALIVNPYDVYEVAAALDRALTMPLEERKERHASQLAAIKQNDVQAWRRRCLGALAGADTPAPVESDAKVAA
jgi:trehalose 6-phosphate synthase